MYKFNPWDTVFLKDKQHIVKHSYTFLGTNYYILDDGGSAAEIDLISEKDYMLKALSQPKKANKFEVGDLVYNIADQEFIVTNIDFSATPLFYMCRRNNIMAYHANMSESDLISETEYVIKMNSLYIIPNIVVAGPQTTIPSYIMPILAPNFGSFPHDINALIAKVEIPSKKCVCGAHAVKDSMHSHWCDIKN
jgi:hypothetical protein